MGYYLEKAVQEEREGGEETRKILQERRKTEAELIAVAEELISRYKKEMKSNPAAAAKTREEMNRIYNELKRFEKENRGVGSLQKVRRSTAKAKLAIAAAGVKTRK